MQVKSDNKAFNKIINKVLVDNLDKRINLVCKVSHQCPIFANVKIGFAVSVHSSQFEKMAKQYWEIK